MSFKSQAFRVWEDLLENTDLRHESEDSGLKDAGYRTRDAP